MNNTSLYKLVISRVLTIDSYKFDCVGHFVQHVFQ